MADRSSSGPPAPEPKRYPGITRHRDSVSDGHGEPRPPDDGQSRGKGNEGVSGGASGHGDPRPTGEAKGVSKGNEKGDQGSEGHGQSRPAEVAQGRGKGKAVDPKGAKASKERAEGPPRPRQVRAKGPLPVTSLGGARPHIREGGQANASANQANTFVGARPRHLLQ